MNSIEQQLKAQKAETRLEKERAERMLKKLKEIRSFAESEGNANLLALLDQFEQVDELPGIEALAIGTSVIKDSGLPFASGLKVNTVSGYCYNPTTGRPSYLFAEDSSCVEVRMCKAETPAGFSAG